MRRERPFAGRVPMENALCCEGRGRSAAKGPRRERTQPSRRLLISRCELLAVCDGRLEPTRWSLRPRPGRVVVPFLAVHQRVSCTPAPHCHAAVLRISPWDPLEVFLSQPRGGRCDTLEARSPLAPVRHGLVWPLCVSCVYTVPTL